MQVDVNNEPYRMTLCPSSIKFATCCFDDHFHTLMYLVSDCPEVPQPEGGMTTGQQEYYDDIYFDSSGSEDERGESEGIRKIGKKVRKMTNDELFYDPKMDEEDEKWMKRQRMTYLNGRLFVFLYIHKINNLHTQ